MAKIINMAFMLGGTSLNALIPFNRLLYAMELCHGPATADLFEELGATPAETICTVAFFFEDEIYCYGAVKAMSDMWGMVNHAENFTSLGSGWIRLDETASLMDNGAGAQAEFAGPVTRNAATEHVRERGTAE